jgi:predicted O-methyltransferase YrrM
MFDFQLIYDEAVDRASDGAVFVEVGSLAGRSACYLGTKIRESGKTIAVYCIDTGRGSASDATGHIIAPSVGGTLAGVFHQNILGCELDDVLTPIFTTSINASRLFQPESVDFCFIDGDHQYASVMADLQAWWPRIKPGGVLAGHDYRQSAPWLLEVTPAVHDFFHVSDAAHPGVLSSWSMAKPLAKV